MASKRAQRRKAESRAKKKCENKRKYSNEKLAEYHARELARKDFRNKQLGGKYNVYKCGNCGFYHVGHSVNQNINLKGTPKIKEF